MGHAAAAGCAVIVNSDSEADELRALNEAAVNIAEEALAAAFSSRASNPTPRWDEGVLCAPPTRSLKAPAPQSPLRGYCLHCVTCALPCRPLHPGREGSNLDHQGCTAACVESSRHKQRCRCTVDTH